MNDFVFHSPAKFVFRRGRLIGRILLRRCTPPPMEERLAARADSENPVLPGQECKPL